MLDVSFTTVPPADDSQFHRPVTLRGAAAASQYGVNFTGDADFVEIDAFRYADDSDFTISLWMSKEQCNSRAAEVLFSNSKDDTRAMADRLNPNINMQLLCESHGAGRPQFDVSRLSGSVIRCKCAARLPSTRLPIYLAPTLDDHSCGSTFPYP
eukprot:COSAG01_NODE_1766_length_9274_cov_3.461094_6_plen_154_part_00